MPDVWPSATKSTKTTKTTTTTTEAAAAAGSETEPKPEAEAEASSTGSETEPDPEDPVSFAGLQRDAYKLAIEALVCDATHAHTKHKQQRTKKSKASWLMILNDVIFFLLRFATTAARCAH